MDLAEYANYDGIGLANLIRNREVTIQEVAVLAMAAVDKVNPKINAIIECFVDQVETAEQWSKHEKPFSGVPIVLKDLGATAAGKRQEMGSRIAKGFIAEADSYLTTCFRKSGAIIFGRATTPEFGFAATTESILTGATYNPWDISRIAGGSSGGSAAAVAAGILPIAHASDGGGSIRIPAACCGVVGLKPSRGRVSCGPDADERLFGLVQEFVVSRTVRDTAAMLDAVSKPAPGDPFVIRQPRQPYLKEICAAPKKLRVAFTAASWIGVEVDSEIAAKVNQIAQLCEDMGHLVEAGMPHFDLETYFEALGVIWGSSLRFNCDQLAQKMGRPVDKHNLEPVTLKIYNSAKRYSAADIIRAKNILNATRRKTGEFFEKYDLLLTPTLAQFPAPIETINQNQEIPLKQWYYGTSRFNAFTNLFNATGLPAISLPLCQSATGLPVGMQFVAGFGKEDLLIRIASAFEQALPWAARKAPVHVSNP